jgi:hypothetical protein
MTNWFDWDAGADFATHQEDEGLLLLGDQTPDWVRLPPELGRRALAVKDVRYHECPLCQDGAPIRHLCCDEGYGVAVCAQHGFVWYRSRVAEKGQD